MTQESPKRSLDDDTAYALRRRVKIARYTEILAHVLHFGPGRTYDVVQRFGLTLETWLAVDEAWVAELGEGIRRQQAGQAMEFSAHFAQFRKRLTREQPTLEAIGSPDPNDLRLRGGAHPNAPYGAPAPLSPLAVPSGALPSAFLPPTSQPAVSRDDGRSPWAASGAPVAPVMTFTPAVAPPPQAMPPAAPPKISTSVAEHKGTTDISAFVPRHLLPFEAGAAPPSISQPAPPTTAEAAAAQRPRVHPGEGTKDISSFVPRHLLPFESGAGAPNTKDPAGTADAGAGPVSQRSNAPPSTGATAGQAPPGKRLVRFDPQTGQAYPTPIWVDIEPSPKK